MTETLSIRLDSATKQRLTALAEHVEQEEWQLGEIRVATAELDAGRAVSHEKAAGWLKSWGTAGEKKAPR
jgi:predicted transcriptional regulator